MKKIDLSKDKIRYIALGDSISEGYNGKFNFAFAGSMENDGNITGASWPAFLARNLQKIDKNILEYYENFAMSGTRPEDWNYFLGVDDPKYNYQNSIDKINYSIWLNEMKNNPERKRIKKQFKNFGQRSKNDFENLISKIKSANLITINIGANYIIPKIPVDDFFDSILNKSNPWESLKKSIIKTIKGIEVDTIKMIERIKEINNDTLIYLIGYNKMFGPFWENLDIFLEKVDLNKKVIEFCYDKINESLKYCAKVTKIYFISPNNKVFWQENNYMMSNVFYEAHPTVYGYKKIAQDVLAKMTLSDEFFASSKNEILSKLRTFNKEYLDQDHKSFANGLDFSNKKINDDDLIKKIYGANDELLFKKTKLETNFQFLETNLYFEQTLDPKNDPRNHLSSSIKRSYLIIINSLGINYDKKIIEDFQNLFEFEYFNEFIIEINLVSIIANKIQDKVDKHFAKTSTSFTQEEFLKIFIDELFDFNLISWVLVKFAKFWTKEKNQKIIQHKKKLFEIFKKLISKNRINIFIKNINEKIVDYLFHYKSNIKLDKYYVKEIINYFVNEIDFYELGSLLFDFYFNSLDKIRTIKDSSDLIILILEDKKIIDYIHDNLSHAISLIKISSNTVSQINKNLNIEDSKQNNQKMVLFFEDILQIIIKEKDIFINMIINALKYFSQSKKKVIQLQDIIEFLLVSDKKYFWSKLANIKINKLSQKDFNNLVEGLNLIFDNLTYDGLLYKSILNLTNPIDIVNKDGDKLKLINLLKFLDKLNNLKKPMSDFSKLLISNYYVSKSKTKENKYYKLFFRILLTSILVSRQLFQKNIKKNIFMGGKISIVRILFQISGYKNGKNEAIDNLMLDMFKENGNYQLVMKNDKFTENQVLKMIYFLDKLEIENEKEIDNTKRVFDLLKKGYIN